MKATEFITEKWSQKYKKSINCSNPKGISQRAHCAGKNKQDESEELAEEFDLIESIIESLADRNGVDSEVIWEDLESLDDDELYVFATTTPVMESQGVAEGEGGLGQVAGIGINGKQFNFSIKDLIAKAQNYPVKKLNPQLFVKQLADRHEDPKQTAARAKSADLQYPIIVVQDGNTLMIADGTHRAQKAIMNKLPSINAYVIPIKDMAEFSKQSVAEDWQKANKRDKTDGMSQKAVNAYRREHPGSKLKTAVTTKPSKLKKGSKASKRRKSYCSRSRGQMKMHNISCAKTPDKAICKARRRWNC